MTREEKLELYYKARDAYYSGSDELMSDWEFDQLEKELGLENKSDLGKSRSVNYTVKHPCIQGSLSKVQVIEDSNGDVNWEKFAKEVLKYTSKAGSPKIEVTPKLDGVSFEFCVEKSRNNRDYTNFVVSTRGDGNYGKDITEWFRPVFDSVDWSGFEDFYNDAPDNNYIIIRGEILVDRGVYNQKYSAFTNPRSFVSGCIGTDWAPVQDNLERREALSWVCYDYRFVPINKTKAYTELSLIDASTKKIAVYNPFTNNKFKNVGKIIPNIALCNANMNAETFHKIYDYFDNIRQSGAYALDGFVFKPQAYARATNNDRARPVDCIAVKFLPMREVTTIIDIIWTAKKSGEYNPVGICEPVTMDGKKITKVSLKNYNWLVTNNVGIGAQITMKLAGDIIPCIANVITEVDIPDTIEEQKEILHIPDDAYTVTAGSGNIKLMTQNDEQLLKFVASCDTLNIIGIGPAFTKELYTLTGSVYNNILYCMCPNIYNEIREVRGTSRSTEKAIQALEAKRQELTLEDIIVSLCIPACGRRASKQCAKQIISGNGNFEHMPSKAINWVYDENSPEYQEVIQLAGLLGVDTANNNVNITNTGSTQANSVQQIPVILTGSPSNFGYKTKKEWLDAHPDYVETTSWKECQLLVTDDLTSTSGKMKKAAANNIPVKTYDLNESADVLFNSLVEKVSYIVEKAINDIL